MDDEQQPEAVWYFPPQKNKSGRIWLLVGIGVIAIAIVVIFLFVVIPRGHEPEPTSSPTTSPTSTPTQSPTPSLTPAPTSTSTSEPSPPPVVDPSLSDFAAQVKPVLDDAVTGLGYAAEDGGESGADDVVLLQEDAQRLSDAEAPASIADGWSDRVSAYLTALDTLQSAYRSGNGVSAAEDAAQGALQSLRDLVGI